ncbi:SDR family NAD(P)-dependent oxidoreductase [Amycolatopsis mediterranei]|uniref:SDR family NAD(P)-dependent oxidoreductase n=1 Tax=Amycolatopsis mediterranei TaxID=33910 RepID=UPI00341BA4A3
MSQVWMVTGSSRGLGRQIATAALSAGHSVVVTARNLDRLADLEESHGNRVFPVHLDVTDPVAAQRAVERATDRFGTLDDSMTMLPVSTPYQQVIGAVANRLVNDNGNQTGDPQRAAAAIVRIAQMPEPPERLILGSDALAYAQNAAGVDPF